MLELENEAIIGIDLAGKPGNPTGWAVWENKKVKTNLIYTGEQIREGITRSKPAIIGADASFTLPSSRIFRKADREMTRRGYRVFPPSLRTMKKLTKQGMKLNKLIAKSGYETIEVHPHQHVKP